MSSHQQEQQMLIALLQVLTHRLCIQGGSLSLQDCNVCSSSGTGIASEGGILTVRNSSIHDCHGNGIAIFADLESQAGRAEIRNSSIKRNQLNGILLREGSQLQLQRCEVASNSGFGIRSKVRCCPLRKHNAFHQ